MSHKKKVSGLNFSALIQSQIKEGRLLFNQQRAIIIDVDALGALRQQMIETLGTDFAQGILSRFGYEHGYNDAKRLEKSFDWETETDWLSAGPFIHALQGLCHVTIDKIDFDRENGNGDETGHFYMEGIWHNSYEVEEHLKRYGPSERPVCWSLTGYASGYTSAFFGHDLLAIETECVGKGDDRCHWEIRPVAEWEVNAVAPHIEALEAMDLASLLTETNQRLRESEARFRDVALSSADWIWEVDTQGRYIYCSERAQDVLGYTVDEILGKTPFDLMTQNKATRGSKYFAQLVAEQLPIVDLENWNIRKDGRTVCLLTNGVPRFDERGNFIGYRGVNKDITERVRAAETLRESEMRYRALFEQANDAIFLENENEEIIDANNRACTMFGYSREELLAMKTSDLQPHTPDRQTFAIYTDPGQPFDTPIETTATRGDGTSIHIEISIAPLTTQDAQQPLFLSVIRDITERKLAEAERERLLAELDSQALQLQTALAQTAALYDISRDLNAAGDKDEILQVMARFATQAGAIQADLMYIDLDANGDPEWSEIVAVWRKQGSHPMPVGTRLYLPEFPLTHLWLSSPSKPLFITDVTTDERVDENIRNTITQMKLDAIISIPLAQAGRWVGLISFGWDKAYEPSEYEAGIYHAFTDLASPAVASCRALVAVEVAREETERLYLISQRLNRCHDEDELLRVMVQPAAEAGAVSANLIHLDLDETGAPIWAEIAAAWQQQNDGSNVTPPVPVGMRYYLPEFPLIRLWLSNPDKPLFIADVSTHEQISGKIKQAMAESGNRAMVIIPLTQGGRWVGLIIFNWDKPHEFGEHEVEIYRAFVGLGSPSVADRRLFAQAQTRARRQQALQEITAIASASEGTTDLVSRLPDLIAPLRQLVPVDLLSIATCIPGESEFTLFAIVEMPKTGHFARRGSRAPLEGSAPGWVIANREPWLDTDIRVTTLQQKSFVGDEQLIAEGIVSRLLMPLQFGEQVVGTLNLGHTQPNTFTREHISTLRQVSNQIAQTLERSRLMESIRAALAETAALYEGSARVVHAATADEVLQALVEYTPLEHFDRANVLMFDHPWEEGNPPTALTPIARWEHTALFTNKAAGIPVGTSYSLDQYPFIDVISRDKPVYIHDVGFYEGIDETLRALMMDKIGIRSLALWPLVAGGQWLGLLTGESGTEQEMSPDEIRQVASLAGQAAAVLQSQHLFAQAQARAKRERLVRTVTDRIRRGTNRDTIVQTTLQELSQILGASKSIARLGTQKELRPAQAGELLENQETPAIQTKAKDNSA